MLLIQSALVRDRPLKPMNRKAGFSLVEVLAALLVTTLLFLALTPLVSQMLATWARGGEIASIVEFRVRGLGILHDDLRHAIVWTGFGRTDNLLVFRGNETSMSFPVASGLGQGRYGVEMLSIEVASRRDGRALIRRRAPMIGSTYGAFTDPVVLFSGPYEFLFKYRSHDGVEKAVWEDPQSSPARVVLNITDGAGRRSSLRIEIPILASISAACLINSNLPGCAAIPPPMEDSDLIKSYMTQLGR